MSAESTCPAPATGAWRPIETAPKDRDILVWCSAAREQSVAFWDSGCWCYAHDVNRNPVGCFPAFWMPLPPAPGTAAPVADGLTEAARDVLAERKRQVEAEGWTPEHDDHNEDEGQLAGAAACYAAGRFVYAGEPSVPGHLRNAATLWPWHESVWKPTTRRRGLEIAGALVLAEIERLDRAAFRAARKEGE